MEDMEGLGIPAAGAATEPTLPSPAPLLNPPKATFKNDLLFFGEGSASVPRWNCASPCVFALTGTDICTTGLAETADSVIPLARGVGVPRPFDLLFTAIDAPRVLGVTPAPAPGGNGGEGMGDEVALAPSSSAMTPRSGVFEGSSCLEARYLLKRLVESVAFDWD